MDARNYYRMVHSYLRRMVAKGALGYLTVRMTRCGSDARNALYAAAQQAVRATHPSAT